jgi:cytochrome c oxidase assembly factor 2
MPPHLHPRSRSTSTLFAATVVASFFVVGLPHVLPCPVPQARFADGEVMIDENGRRRRWRRKETPEVRNGIAHFGQSTPDDELMGGGGERLGAASGKVVPQTRECPVPKPGGMIGEWLGFHKDSDETRPARVNAETRK